MTMKHDNIQQTAAFTDRSLCCWFLPVITGANTVLCRRTNTLLLLPHCLSSFRRGCRINK